MNTFCGYIDEETLAITISADADFNEFGIRLEYVVDDYVEFNEHLNLILSNIDGNEIWDIQIN